MRLLSRMFGRRRPTYHTACAGCDRLGQLVRTKDVSGLIELLKGDRRHLSETAASLVYLTGRDFGTDAAAWKSWCRKQKQLPEASVN
jgi:hypothetical protein